MEAMADSTTKGKATQEDGRLYKLHLIRHRIRHGLILHSFLNLMLRVGVSINPYWIDVEGLHLCKEPGMRDDKKQYRIGPIDKSVVLELYQNLQWNTDELKERLSSDYHAVGLFRQDALAAFMLMRYQSFDFKNNHISFSDKEAYLENMYTYEDYRGRSLAPYLRYQAYKLLEVEGRTTCYSITQYFNASSRKFKAKLNAQHSELWLHLGFFGKFKYNILLKKYPNSWT
jgi:hypothetical protein